MSLQLHPSHLLRLSSSNAMDVLTFALSQIVILLFYRIARVRHEVPLLVPNIFVFLVHRIEFATYGIPLAEIGLGFPTTRALVVRRTGRGNRRQGEKVGLHPGCVCSAVLRFAWRYHAASIGRTGLAPVLEMQSLSRSYLAIEPPRDLTCRASERDGYVMSMTHAEYTYAHSATEFRIKQHAPFNHIDTPQDMLQSSALSVHFMLLTSTSDHLLHSR